MGDETDAYYEQDLLEEYREIMQKHKLPPLEGTIVKMRCTFAGEEWWAKTEHGWFWLRRDALDRKWIPAPLGPPGENP